MSCSTVEIRCSRCGQESLLKRAPRYEGFKKVGEILSCAACGHIYSSEADVPFKQTSPLKIFDDSDAPRTIHIFHEHEADRLCRYCRNFVVNPFLQRCGKHGRLVEATDTCRDFEKKSLPKV